MKPCLSTFEILFKHNCEVSKYMNTFYDQDSSSFSAWSCYEIEENSCIILEHI